ncbi:MAG: hypothetical protein HYY90_05335 [Candidatus Omnitrophica bacterium]|nr:hypothetical protein [Candidatus Omnitrophota bacterium]MBI3020847.1 hypothetical protein [Candidatus Omnitrophota bacterium]MBI3083766.1 hypothetical protein [Candidatus Omnitrophota bacterium]
MLASTVVVCVSASLQARQEHWRLHEELTRRAAVLAESLQELIEPLLDTEKQSGLQRVVERFGNRERLAGVAVYTTEGLPLAMTTSLPAEFQTTPAVAQDAIQADEGRSGLTQAGHKRWHLFALPLRHSGGVVGVVALVHDASYIDANTVRLWKQSFTRLFVHVLFISLITFLIVRWSLIRPMATTVEWIKRLRIGEVTALHGALPKGDLFGPLAREVTHMAKSLVAAKAAAEEEAKLRHAGESRWTPERLKEHVRLALQGRVLVIVANREPYDHSG